MARGLQGWALTVVERLGEAGVGALIALENLVPPVPLEVVLPFAGYVASQGRLDPVLVWAAATAGALLGAYVLYAVGALVGPRRLHDLAGKRWPVLFGQTDLACGERFFALHGGKVVLLGRLAPFVRSVVSVPAGATRMPLVRFSALTTVGSGVWNGIFVGLGYSLGERWEQAERYAQPLGYAVLVAAVVGLAVLVVRRRRAAG